MKLKEIGGDIRRVNTRNIVILLRTSMCTTRSDMVLASLFSSIILSNPSALDPRFSTAFRVVELLESDDECPELFIEPASPEAVARGVEPTALLLLMGGLASPAADAGAAFVHEFTMADSSA